MRYNRVVLQRGLGLGLLLLSGVALPLPVVADPAPAEKKPLVSPPDEAYPSRFPDMENVATYFCHTRNDKGIQSSVTLEIDFAKRTVNETQALISPLEIQWIRTDARGRSFMYRLNRYSGWLQGGALREQNQTGGWCERIQNR